MRAKLYNRAVAARARTAIFVAAFCFAATFARADDSMKNFETFRKGKTPAKRVFFDSVEKSLTARRLDTAAFCDADDAVAVRILHDYGAVFLAAEQVKIPPVCVFATDEQVKKFVGELAVETAETDDGETFTLQAAAMRAYQAARDEAQKKGLDITPRDGAEAAGRSFADTVRLWNSRFEPACRHWQNLGRLSAAQVAALKALPVKDQVREVLELEKLGIYFNTFFNRSILYSVAAPGTSQHLSLLALDINEFDDEKVREIMHKFGWFRTVRNDAPHFTFLGLKKDDLKKVGLKKLEEDGDYYVPNV